MAKDKTPTEILQEGFDQFHENLKKAPEDIESVHGPYWNARYELAKNVVSLSSASLVFTITFSKSVIDTATVGVWKYLLFGSWLAFLLSLISAVSCLWISIKLKSFGARLFNQRAKIREAIEQFDISKPNPTNEIERLLLTALSPMQPVDKWAGRLLHASLILFIVALALLGSFGWKQFAA
jgi:hypothetical protein